jgi:hypothetical protein
MARAQRRNRMPLIATVPGQRGRIGVQGSRYGIFREPDRFTIHEGGGAEHVTVEGSEHHIHVPAVPPPAPGPTGPLIDFNLLGREIDAKLLEARKFMGGFPQLPKVERTSKLWPLVRHPNKSKLVFGGYEGWLILHPLKLLGKIFRKQKGEVPTGQGERVLKQPGIFASRKEGRRMAAAAAWRNESGVERRMQEAHQRLENSMRAAAGELRQKVETGAVRPDNRGEHIAIYNDAVSKAWLRFQGEITGILKQFREGYKEDDQVVKGAIDRGIIKRRPKWAKVEAP